MHAVKKQVVPMVIPIKSHLSRTILVLWCFLIAGPASAVVETRLGLAYVLPDVDGVSNSFGPYFSIATFPFGEEHQFSLEVSRFQFSEFERSIVSLPGNAPILVSARSSERAMPILAAYHYTFVNPRPIGTYRFQVGPVVGVTDLQATIRFTEGSDSLTFSRKQNAFTYGFSIGAVIPTAYRASIELGYRMLRVEDTRSPILEEQAVVVFDKWKAQLLSAALVIPF